MRERERERERGGGGGGGIREVLRMFVGVKTSLHCIHNLVKKYVAKVKTISFVAMSIVRKVNESFTERMPIM